VVSRDLIVGKSCCKHYSLTVVDHDIVAS
jgi:hypothetical protein